ncbi:replication initiator protein A [uncultured Enterococcus sp.]|uniref:replication initiator protein A n=1 Tax=uncultured Enterococcus sp. TaxID=167972 RepID=UPI0022DA6E7B|nr:replication initiator protein A [uncultured Enterococcus sp.]CAI3403797.1 replication initiator protein A [Enterococcus cecorum]
MADIKINQIATQNFFQIPQIFMTRTEKKMEGGEILKIKYTSDYAKELSNDAKLAYAALYNRCQLSIKSYELGKKDFVDEDGSIFLIYTVEDLMDLLDKSRGTVIKIKKELNKLGLLREVRQGLNKPNKLYLQLVDASHQIIEFYDELGNSIVLSDDKSENLDRQGSLNFGLPKNELQEVQILDASKNELSKNTHIDTKLDTHINWQESFLMLSDNTFLDKACLNYIAQCSPDYVSAKKFVDTVYQTKKLVCKEWSDYLKSKKIADDCIEIVGEDFNQDLFHTIQRIFAKNKILVNQGKNFLNQDGFIFKVLLNFWRSCAFEINHNQMTYLYGKICLSDKIELKLMQAEKELSKEKFLEFLYLPKEDSQHFLVDWLND